MEDAAAGIKAGLNAKMWTMDLGPQERVGGAHLTYPNLENVTWASVLETLIRISQTTPSQTSSDSA